MTPNRILALLLALFMLFSMMPLVHAADQEESSTDPTSDNLPEEEVESEESGGEAVAPEDTTETIEDTTEVTEDDSESVTEESDDSMSDEIYTGPPESDTIPSLYVGMEDPGEYAVAPMAESPDTYVTTRNNNYMLLRCKDGNIINWHYVDFDQKAPWEDYNLIYCLDFGKAFSSGTGNSGDLDISFEGTSQNSGPAFWYGLSADQRRTIGLILLYGCPNDLWDEEWGINTSTNKQNPNIGYRAATQALIWEIEAGYREPSGDYELLNDRWYDGMQGYNLSADGTTDYFLVGYNHIVSKLKQHNTIPSFTSSYANSAPVHAMTGTALTLTDTNDILSEYTFTNTSAVTFSKSGNNLTVQTTGTIPSTAFSAMRNLPKPEDCVYQIFWNGLVLNTYQPQIRIAVPAYDPVPAYFKLKASNGSIEIQKSVNVSGNLSGWVFDVYTNSACTSLYGTYTTDSNGKISITNVPDGTFYIRERASSNVYWECDGSTHAVTVKASETAKLTVDNTYRGRAVITKRTNTGDNLSGWIFGIYSDAACKKQVATLTSGTNGKTDLVYLEPDIYYWKEIGDNNNRFGSEYWPDETKVQSFTITVGKETALEWNNNHYGKLKIIKTMPDGGSVAGWQFEVRKDSDNSLVGTFTTAADGTILTGNLLPGKYKVYELIPEDSLYICDSVNPQAITITAGQTTEVTFSNRLKPAEISIQKLDESGNPLTGAEFLLEWSEDGVSWKAVTKTDSQYVSIGACSSAGLSNGKLTSGVDGVVTFSGLHPLLQYRLIETAAPEGHQLLTDPIYVKEIASDSDLSISIAATNTPVFVLPLTGSHGFLWISVSSFVLLAACLGLSLCCHRKEE